MSLLALNEYKYHTFLGIVYTVPFNKTLDLEKLAHEFKLDVFFNKDKTQLLQKTDESVTIIDQSFEICSSRLKNKKLNNNNSKSDGFVKVSFPKSPDTMLYTNPPDFISIGTYCVFCYNEGPYTHAYNCPGPKKTSLSLTLSGFLSYYYDHNSLVSSNNNINNFIALLNEITSIDGHKKVRLNITSVQELIQIISENKPDLLQNSVDILKKIFIDPDRKEHTSISLSDVQILTKKDVSGKFFSGPVMIKYKQDNGLKNVTIRVRSNGRIELISNPWSLKNLYKDLLKRINETSQKVSYIRSEIKSLFASVNIFGQENKQLNMTNVYNYFNQSSESGGPKEDLAKDGYFYMGLPIYTNVSDKDIDQRTQRNVYRYTVVSDKKSKNRLYFRLIPCKIRTVPGLGLDLEELVIGRYKISVQLFSQGPLQLTFGLCDESDSVISDETNIDSQLQSIQKIFVDLQNVFISVLNDLIKKDPSTVLDIEPKSLSKKIYETIDGSIPYAKRKKFKVNDLVNIFNFKTRTWSSKVGLIKDVVKNDNTDPERKYIVEVDSCLKKLSHSKLRRVDANNDQVCRFKENNIPKQPVPYSFLEGQVPGGLNQIIKPIGIVSRSDNKCYPYCDIVKKDDLEWTVNFLLNGLTQEEKVAGFIDRNTSDIDYFCGTFKPGTCKIGSHIMVYKPTEKQLVSVQITDKYKTHGLGNDNNIVKYNVIDETGLEFTVTGRDFHEKYIENRNFPGLNNMFSNPDIIYDILIESFRKLHLVENNAMDYLNNNDAIVDETIKNLLKSCKYQTVNLTSKNINKLLGIDFVTVVIPENIEDTTHAFLCFVNNKLYISDNAGSIKFIETVDDRPIDMVSFVLDGFLTNDLKYYPISVLNSSNNTDLNTIVSCIRSNYLKIQNPNGLVENLYNDSYMSHNEKIKFINRKLTKKGFVIFILNDYMTMTYYQWSSIKKRTVVLQLIQKNKNLWKVGLMSENGPIIIPSLDYNIPLTSLKDHNDCEHIPELYDYISIKPNIMLDCTLNQLEPILEPMKVSKDHYLGLSETSLLLDQIMFSVPIETLLDNKWIIPFQEAIYTEQNNRIVKMTGSSVITSTVS